MEYKPKLVIAHSGYDNSDLERFTVRFKKRIDKMINLRYEQVMSKKVTDSTLHFPREYMKNTCCVCWSEEIKKQMIKKGFSEENLCVTEDIKTDFSHRKFDSFYKTKGDLAKEFNLDSDKDWILFISSFTFKKGDTEYRLSRYNNNLEDGRYLQSWDIKSKEILISWIKKFIERHTDKEFIYRPHPSEDYDYELSKLSDDFDNM